MDGSFRRLVGGGVGETEVLVNLRGVFELG